MTIWRLRIACRITEATNMYSEYVTMFAFARQQRLYQRAFVLCLYVHWRYNGCCSKQDHTMLASLEIVRPVEIVK